MFKKRRLISSQGHQVVNLDTLLQTSTCDVDKSFSDAEVNVSPNRENVSDRTLNDEKESFAERTQALAALRMDRASRLNPRADVLISVHSEISQKGQNVDGDVLEKSFTKVTGHLPAQPNSEADVEEYIQSKLQERLKSLNVNHPSSLSSNITSGLKRDKSQIDSRSFGGDNEEQNQPATWIAGLQEVSLPFQDHMKVVELSEAARRKK